MATPNKVPPRSALKSSCIKKPINLVLTETQQEMDGHLKDIDSQLDRLRDKIKSSVDATDPQFVSACTNLEALKQEIDDKRQSVNEIVSSANAAHNKLSIDDLSVESNALGVKMGTINKTIDFLEVVLSIVSDLTSCDEVIDDANNLVDGSRFLEQIESKLARITILDSSNNESSIPILNHVKQQYFERRGFVVSQARQMLVEDAMIFSDRRLQVNLDKSNTSNNIANLWATLRNLKSTKFVLRHVASQLSSRIIDPLLEDCKNSPVSIQITDPRKVDVKSGSRKSVGTHGGEIDSSGTVLPLIAIWTWDRNVYNDKNADLANTLVGVNSDIFTLSQTEASCVEQHNNNTLEKHVEKTSIVKLAPCIQSLISFVSEHIFKGRDGKAEFAMLGEVLWSSIAKKIISSFEILSEEDSAAAVQLEEYLMIKKFIQPMDSPPLTKYVNNRIEFKESTFKTQLLDKVRVDLLNECLGSQIVEIFMTKEKGVLQVIDDEYDGDEFCTFPRCFVSVSVLDMINDLQSYYTTIDDKSFKTDETSLCRQLIHLFILLRGFGQHKEICENSLAAAIFVNDCNVLSHVLLWISDSVNVEEGGFKFRSTFADLVVQLRSVADEVFSECIEVVTRTRVIVAIDAAKLCWERGLIDNDDFVTAEAAIGSSFEILKSVSKGWKSVLPPVAYAEALGVLCVCLVETIAELTITACQTASFRSSAASLLESVMTTIPTLFDNGEVDAKEFISTWSFANTVHTCIYGDTGDIFACKDEISKYFKGRDTRVLTNLFNLNHGLSAEATRAEFD